MTHFQCVTSLHIVGLQCVICWKTLTVRMFVLIASHCKWKVSMIRKCILEQQFLRAFTDINMKCCVVVDANDRHYLGTDGGGSFPMTVGSLPGISLAEAGRYEVMAPGSQWCHRRGIWDASLPVPIPKTVFSPRRSRDGCRWMSMRRRSRQKAVAVP